MDKEHKLVKLKYIKPESVDLGEIASVKGYSCSPGPTASYNCEFGPGNANACWYGDDAGRACGAGDGFN